jgi:putative membrane protein
VSGALVAMTIGVRAIKRRRARRHARAMQIAFGFSALFLITFVTRFVMFGVTEFRGEGITRAVFMAAWLSHEPIAFVSVPLVTVAFVLAMMRRFDTHRQVARMALPLWAYAAVTGLLIYVMLYLR